MILILTFYWITAGLGTLLYLESKEDTEFELFSAWSLGLMFLIGGIIIPAKLLQKVIS